jgi:hypothetical protein
MIFYKHVVSLRFIACKSLPSDAVIPIAALDDYNKFIKRELAIVKQDEFIRDLDVAWSKLTTTHVPNCASPYTATSFLYHCNICRCTDQELINLMILFMDSIECSRTYAEHFEYTAFSSYIRRVISSRGMAASCNMLKSLLYKFSPSGVRKCILEFIGNDIERFICDTGNDGVFLACGNGLYDILQYKLSHREADVNATCSNGRFGKFAYCSLLHISSYIGDVKTSTLLIEYNANVNAQGNDNWTPLHFAAKFDSHGTVVALISHGADVNAKDNPNLIVIALLSR